MRESRNIINPRISRIRIIMPMINGNEEVKDESVCFDFSVVLAAVVCEDAPDGAVFVSAAPDDETVSPDADEPAAGEVMPDVDDAADAEADDGEEGV